MRSFRNVTGLLCVVSMLSVWPMTASSQKEKDPTPTLMKPSVTQKTVPAEQPPPPTSGQPLQLSLRSHKGRVELVLDRPPSRLEVYAGERRLARIPGSNRKHFDVTPYLGKAQDGRLTFHAFDAAGGRASKTFDVRKYAAAGAREKAAPATKTGAAPTATTAGKAEPALEKSSPAATKVPPTARKLPPPPPSEQPPSTQAGKSDDAEVSAFLERLQKARSLEEVKKDLEAARFSEAQMRQLQREITSPAYRPTVERLQTQQLKQVRRAAPALVERPEAKLAQLQKASDSAHLSKIDPVNRQARSEWQRLRARPALAAARPGAVRSERDTMEMEAHAGLRSAADAPVAVTAVKPASPAFGAPVELSGRGFGGSGSVRVSIRREAERHPCTATTWRDDQIVFELPESFSIAVGEAEQRAVIWVEAEGATATASVSIGPDRQRLTPEIVAISSSTIHPRMDFLITGRHFLADRPGEAVLTFAGVGMPLGIVEWRDDYIMARIPDIIGLKREVGSITVRNHLGVETTGAGSRPVTFEPRLTTEEFPIWSGELTCTPETVGHPDECILWFFCAWGHRDLHLVRRPLYNGARVVGHAVDERAHWGCGRCGANCSRPPEPNARRMDVTIEHWVDGWAACEHDASLFIEAPAGVNVLEDTYTARLCWRESSRPDGGLWNWRCPD
jgi:hypothetical protein